MTRVLFDHQIFSRQNFGGVSTYFAYVYANLKKLPDVQAKLPIVLSSNVNLDMVEPSGIKHLLREIDIKGKAKVQYAINQFVSKIALKSKKYDVFHPTYYDTYFLPYLEEKPFVITVFDMIHEIYPEMFASTEVAEQKANIAHKATHLIAISESTKKDMIEKLHVPAEKISIVFMAGDNINFVQNDPNSIDQVLPKRYVLYVGDRKAMYKNFTNFVKGVAPVLKKDAELYLVTVGGGEFTPAEKALFVEYAIESQVVGIPLTNKAPIQRFFYEKAEMFVYPSIYEGFGIPLVEAMLCDCPTVASNESCFPEIAQDASTYFSPKNIDDITNAIETVLHDKERQKKQIALGRLRAQEFTWLKSAEKSKQIYDSLV
jgi:glycosyltransferase involved in cell wall biosynthesis